VHKKTTVAALAGIALLLVGCQSAPVDPAGEKACVPAASGTASDAVQVRWGETVPSITVDGTLAPYRTQRTVDASGDGRMAENGSLVTFAYAAFDATSGELIDSAGFDSPYSQVVLDGTSLVAGMEKALLCTTAGSRIVAVVPASDAFGEAGLERYGIEGEAPIVLAINLLDVAADRAQGESQTVMDSLPRVEVGATGEPQVTIPPRSAPDDYSATVLKLGTGDVVAEGATVTVEYLGVEWQSGRTFDSSWYRDQLVRMPTSSFLKGIGDALVGKTVGSQVLVVLPPKFGYGDEGNMELGIDADDTMVFVVDILTVLPMPAAEAGE
jgi:peptidylprolyl isomerase